MNSDTESDNSEDSYDDDEEDDRKLPAQKKTTESENINVFGEVIQYHKITTLKSKETQQYTLEHGSLLVKPDSMINYKRMIKDVVAPGYYEVLGNIDGIEKVESSILESAGARIGIQDMAFVNGAMLYFLVVLKIDLIGMFNTGITELIQQVFSKSYHIEYGI